MKIYFEKLANFERKNEYSKVSIPFKAGELFDKDYVAIKDSFGNRTPVQTEVVALHKDKSIKWLLVHFLANLNANSATDFEITFDKCSIDKAININDYIKKFETLTFNVTCDGKTLNKNINFENYKIIKEGSILSEILIEDTFNVSETKTLDLKFIISFYKDKDYIKLDIKLTNNNIDDFELSNVLVNYTFTGKSCTHYIAQSNYKTTYIEDDIELYDEITEQTLLYKANEHFAETFFGAYYGVLRNEENGIAITIKDAFQNYPKVLKVSSESINAYLIPESSKIKFNSGVAKTHTLYIQSLNSNQTKQDINERHHQFQMEDHAFLDKQIYVNSGLYNDIFGNEYDKNFERFLEDLIDAKGCAYGMMHFGDTYSDGYTKQGRGGDNLVFFNNEYDFPYYAHMFYIRNKKRRFYDYFISATKHMIDIDICHFSNDPYRHNGLIEHSKEHTTGPVALSHQWLRGIIAYYHETGDIFAKEAFLNMGENILRNLERPEYSQGFEVNVRETGWALFALTGLYEETYDEKYLIAAKKIANHFIDWKNKYGALLAPYTDHTLIRVPFMIAVACNSLYSYYKITKDKDVLDLIIFSMDDLIENALMENGLFYYKELPSLARNGNNPIILETLANCYKHTNNKKYLDAGITSYEDIIKKKYSTGGKFAKDGAVVLTGEGTKYFTQAFYPLILFHNLIPKL